MLSCDMESRGLHSRAVPKKVRMNLVVASAYSVACAFTAEIADFFFLFITPEPRVE